MGTFAEDPWPIQSKSRLKPHPHDREDLPRGIMMCQDTFSDEYGSWNSVIAEWILLHNKGIEYPL